MTKQDKITLFVLILFIIIVAIVGAVYGFTAAAACALIGSPITAIIALS